MRQQHIEFATNSPAIRISAARRGATIHLVIIAAFAILLFGGGLAYYLRSDNTVLLDQPITAPVTRGDFVTQVLDQGKIESSENVEIKCAVEARGGNVTVLEVVPEGARVKGGDFLVKLDSSSFEKELQQQKISVSSAETAVIQAKAAMNTAVESKKEYEQGTYEESRIQIENEIYTAEQQLEQAYAVVEYSEKLQKKGFVNLQKLKSDLIAVEQAKNSLELAKKKLYVLKEITFNKELIRLQGDIDASKVQLANQQEDLLDEKAEYEEILKQIENCTIKVPEGLEGQVVYNKEFSRGGNQEWVLEEGASVRERQVLIRLPNPEKMQVKASINEQSISTVAPGMPVSIKIDALPGVKLKGVVTAVSQYAESSGWMSSSIPKFPVYIQIIDPPETLKADMTAACSIQTELQNDVLKVPIQCVYSAQDKHFCLVSIGDKKWETREVEVGSSNSVSAWIAGGLEEGDEVAMNPGAYKEILELPEELIDDKIELTEEEKKAVEGEIKSKQKDGPPMDGRGKTSGKGKGRPGGAGGGGFNMGAMVDGTMKRYDTNSDGKIDKEELESVDDRFKSRIKDADTDGDDAISKDELSKAFAKMMQGMQGGGGSGGGGRGGRGGRGGGGQ